jgi:phosphoglycolate phosphatase-like HAD superfamily hydrolase
MHLILWDLDGTLLRAGPVAAEIFDGAVAAVSGLDPSGHGVSMSGKTDPQIAAEILARQGVDEASARRLVPAILDELAGRLAASRDRVATEGRLLPGVASLLASLESCRGVAQSVLTGNIATNARLKTAMLGVAGRLDWRLGAFGSDHADRRELVGVARRRAAGVLGAEPEVVWVVGDTPHDLACARAGGARCLLVATGRFERERLEGLGADAVVDDLTATDALTRLLGSTPQPAG